MDPLATRLTRVTRRRILRWEAARRITRLAQMITRFTPPEIPDQPPILFFAASTRLTGTSLNAAYSLLSGWALRLQGYPIVRLQCQSALAPCVLGTKFPPTKDASFCEGCRAQSTLLSQPETAHWFLLQADLDLSTLLASLGVKEMENFSYQGIPLGQITVPSLRWILRRHDLVDDDMTRSLFSGYIQSAWSLVKQATPLLQQKRPEALVVFNGMFYPEATLRWVAASQGVRVISHEVGLRPFSAFFTDGEATAYPIDIPADFRLNEEQNNRLDIYLSQRFQGNFTMAGIRFWPEIKRLPEEFWERARGFRQIVPVFTNVIFDTSQSHANTLFKDMFAWLDALLEIIQHHPETLFVIRAHPDEKRPGKESRQSVADWIRQKDVTALNNVLYVDANEPLSSYELIQNAKFILVYNSTIGLEASILGAAVLCGGKARFTQVPTVFFPDSTAAYLQQAEDFLSQETIAIPAEFQQNARRFLYYQLYRVSLPFQEFLEEDGVWRGYVRLKKIPWQSLLPQNSPTIRCLLDGFLHGKSFVLESSEENP